MSSPRVICLGEILFDYLANQRGRTLSEVETWTPYPGGAPANVACALVKLGTPATFLGCVGQDEPGKSLVELLQTVGVDTSGVQQHASAPTRLVYVLRSESGEREFAGFGDRAPDQFADAYLEADRLPVGLFEAADFLVLGTLELAYPTTRQAVFRALELSEEYNLRTLLDVNWRPKFWPHPDEAIPTIKQLWHYVDFLKLSREEAQWLFGTTEAGAIAYQLDSVEGVLITDGSADIKYSINDHEGKLPSFEIPVQDTTGAGDGFVAGFIHQLCQRGVSSLNDPEVVRDVLTYACAVGGLTTTKPGAIAAQPTAAQVEAFLQSGKLS